MNSTSKKLFIFALGAAVLISLSSCQLQDISSYFVGLQTEPEESLPLPNAGVHSGQWKTFDLQIDYHYAVENQSLNISGNIIFGNYYQINFAALRDLEIFLFFLDKESRVLETARILRGLGRDLSASRHFEEILAIPESTRAISFGYRGSARAERRQQIERFHHLPKHTPD
ncbi:MAG: hypothetical protein C0619_15360 [Desulfuromonas sp.]|jgi:hypothetical protein|nr:MAG: hypothetical protein C0619_15360 [Desulfuromonas sp.]